MTYTPDRPAPSPLPPKETPPLKPVSHLKLSLGRPLLPLRVSRTVAWLVFIFGALLPLCVAAAIILYLTSSRWPSDFSNRLSRATGLDVSVGLVTVKDQSNMDLHDINIAPRSDLPVLLYAAGGSYTSGQTPTLSLTDVEVNLDLDWWSDPKSIPPAGLFFPEPSRSKPPVLTLHDLSIRLRTSGRTHVVRSSDAVALLSNGLVRLRTNPARNPAAKPEAPAEQINIVLGYQDGSFVRRLTVRQAPPELLREYLARAIGSDWTAALTDISGDLVVRNPADGANWEIDGRATFDPSLLAESSGLRGLGGQFEVKFKNVSGYDDKVLEGEFDVALARNPYKVPACSAEALRGLQFVATGTEPALASGMGSVPFERASAVITVHGSKIYIHTAEKDDAVMSSGGVPIISFPPQEITRQEWSRRLDILKNLWARARVS